MPDAKRTRLYEVDQGGPHPAIAGDVLRDCAARLRDAATRIEQALDDGDAPAMRCIGVDISRIAAVTSAAAYNYEGNA